MGYYAYPKIFINLRNQTFLNFLLGLHVLLLFTWIFVQGKKVSLQIMYKIFKELLGHPVFQ